MLAKLSSTVQWVMEIIGLKVPGRQNINTEGFTAERTSSVPQHIEGWVSLCHDLLDNLLRSQKPLAGLKVKIGFDVKVNISYSAAYMKPRSAFKYRK